MSIFSSTQLFIALSLRDHLGLAGFFLIRVNFFKILIFFLYHFIEDIDLFFVVLVPVFVLPIKPITDTYLTSEG